MLKAMMAVLVYPSCDLWKGLFFAAETWAQPFSQAWLWGEALLCSAALPALWHAFPLPWGGM